MRDLQRRSEVINGRPFDMRRRTATMKSFDGTATDTTQWGTLQSPVEMPDVGCGFTASSITLSRNVFKNPITHSVYVHRRGILKLDNDHRRSQDFVWGALFP